MLKQLKSLNEIVSELSSANIAAITAGATCVETSPTIEYGSRLKNIKKVTKNIISPLRLNELQN